MEVESFLSREVQIIKLVIELVCVFVKIKYF